MAITKRQVATQVMNQTEYKRIFQHIIINLNTKEANLHVKCNHLSTVHPPNQRAVIRGVKACTLWVYPEHILLSEPRCMLSISNTLEHFASNV